MQISLTVVENSNHPVAMAGFSLLKFEIGPVQEFLAQARSTRDLWSGSYLLSWLVGRALRDLESSVRVVYPRTEEQPLLARNPEESKDLIPNLPNLFIVRVPVEVAESVIRKIEHALKDAWREISEKCWNVAIENKLVKEEMEDRFFHQTERFLNVYWACVPEEDSYETSYRKLVQTLSAVRQTRTFTAWSSGGWNVGEEFRKDSLTGKEEAVTGGEPWANGLEDEEFQRLFRNKGDWLGSITLIKRIWHAAYLNRSDIRFPSTWDIARHEPRNDGERGDNHGPDPNKPGYFAVLVMDGDQIGKWMAGSNLSPGEDLETHHREFSRALSDFALTQVRAVVGNFDGYLIYAGGDDVVALLPADNAVDCACALRNIFREKTKMIQDRDGGSPDVSAGLAIAHAAAPFQDVIKAAQAASKRAKSKLDRSALAITLYKRSGATLEWGMKWDSPGRSLFQAVEAALKNDAISSRFPHLVCEALSRYTVDPKTIAAGASRRVSRFDEHLIDTVLAEITHVLSRREGKKESTEWRALRHSIETDLPKYLDLIASRHIAILEEMKGAKSWEYLTAAEQCRLEAAPIYEPIDGVIGLCSVAEFTRRPKTV